MFSCVVGWFVASLCAVPCWIVSRCIVMCGIASYCVDYGYSGFAWVSLGLCLGFTCGLHFGAPLGLCLRFAWASLGLPSLGPHLDFTWASLGLLLRIITWTGGFGEKLSPNKELHIRIRLPLTVSAQMIRGVSASPPARPLGLWRDGPRMLCER